MFSHVAVGSNDLNRSKRFYDALFAVVGVTGAFDAKGRLIYRHRGANLMVTKPINGMPAQPANGGTIGFLLESEANVDAWHAAGVGAGGSPIEEPPGARGRLYLAYLRDPDGNKLCGLFALS